jgi:hypothetical protein
MIEVTSSTIWDSATGLDKIARAILGDNTAGVSIAGTYSAIVLLNDTPELIETATNILDGYNTITVTSDPAIMTEGAGDVTITCNDPLLANDSDAGYVVLLDGALFASGTDSITAGGLELTLPDPVDGTYTIYIYRLGTPYQSGLTLVQVNEV